MGRFWSRFGVSDVAVGQGQHSSLSLPMELENVMRKLREMSHEELEAAAQEAREALLQLTTEEHAFADDATSKAVH